MDPKTLPPAKWRAYPTAEIQFRGEELRLAGLELRISIDQIIWGVPPGALEYVYEICEARFARARSELENAWAAWSGEWEEDVTGE